MQKHTKSLLSLAVFTATLTLPALAATDAERIKALETQLEQQRQMLEAMDAELKRLKAGQPATISEEAIAVTEGLMSLQFRYRTMRLSRDLNFSHHRVIDLHQCAVSRCGATVFRRT